MDYRNSTHLADERLEPMIREGLHGWSVGNLALRIRYSRGADYSGTCFYTHGVIYVNLGQHLRYPYPMETNLARAETLGNRWRRPVYALHLRDGYEVVLFVFMHELYHLLVYRSRRNVRQKESMCDRFAARWLVDRFASRVRDPQGRSVPRSAWDFQDLDGFVAAARDRNAPRRRAAAACRAGRNGRQIQGRRSDASG
jgi:hypothetical protein